MNVFSGLGILVALAANFLKVRSQAQGEPAILTQVGTHALFYVNAAVAIWFFHNWIKLLALEEGESTRLYHEVVWQLIAVMIPLVLATTGRRHWRQNSGRI